MKTWKNKIHKIVAVLLALCLVTSCMEVTNAQAATSKSGTMYYYTQLYQQKGGRKLGANGYYYDTGTMKVTCKGNTLTMYSSFCKTKTGRLDNSQKFVKYGKHTFKLTSKTKYWSYKYTDGNEKYYFTKAKFMSSVKRFNGLGLWIKVKDGKVVEMSLHS